MNTWAHGSSDRVSMGQQSKRKLLMIVSSDKDFAESLRSHLAKNFDVLLAKYGGEAASKALALHPDIVLVDLGVPVLGLPALARIKTPNQSPVICALAPPRATEALSQMDFDYVLARPSDGTDFVERIHFILAKMEHAA